MITPSSCKESANQYKALSQESGISGDRAFLLKNIARTFTGLSGQLDRLAALAKHEEKSKNSRTVITSKVSSQQRMATDR